MSLGKGFLRRSINEEPGGDDPLEEQYEKIFPKIGRDFVYREDLEQILSEILLRVDPLGTFGIDLSYNLGARRKALEYKELLDSGRDGSEIYRDLIDLDDD